MSTDVPDEHPTTRQFVTSDDYPEPYDDTEETVAAWERVGTSQRRLRTTHKIDTDDPARVLRRNYEKEAYLASTEYVLDLTDER